MPGLQRNNDRLILILLIFVTALSVAEFFGLNVPVINAMHYHG